MAQDKWGTKRACGECTTNFYDMNRSDIICPKCGTKWEASMAVTKPVMELVSLPLKKGPSLEDLAVDMNELTALNNDQFDMLYGDLLDDDFGSEEIKDVSEIFESQYVYKD